jgi:hypothetical protein
MESMGSAAVNIVVDAVNAAAENRRAPALHRKLPSELVIRESTSALRPS